MWKTDGVSFDFGSWTELFAETTEAKRAEKKTRKRAWMKSSDTTLPLSTGKSGPPYAEVSFSLSALFRQSTTEDVVKPLTQSGGRPSSLRRTDLRGTSPSPFSLPSSSPAGKMYDFVAVQG